MLDEGTSGLRKQHLPSVPSTHHACGLMHVQTSIALGGKRWFACMEPHTDTHDHSFGPDMRGEGTLCCHCRCYGIGGASKSHEEGISLGVHDVPVPPPECCAEELAVLLQQVGVALAHLLKQTGGPLHVGEEQSDGSHREVMHIEPLCLALSCCSRSSVTLLLLIGGSAFSSSTPLRTLRSVVSLFPVFQCFYHAYIGTLREEGLLGDNIVQMRIQIQCLFVPLSDMQSDFGIVVLARLLLRTLQQARTDPLAAPISEHSERIDIPFIVLRLPFEPASNGGVEPGLISTPKAQNQSDHL